MAQKHSAPKAESFKYTDLIAPIVKTIQEALAKIEAILARINPLAQEIKMLKTQKE